MWVKYIQENISLSRLYCFGGRESEYSMEFYVKMKDRFQPQDLSVLRLTFLLEK